MFDVFVDWLDSDDPEHIEAALLANDGFLFRDRASMQKKFDELVRRMPRFEERTSEVLRAWDAQFGDKAFDELLAGTRTVESVARLLGVSEEETRSRANAYRQARSGE
jgi:low affinity Fe/Cu permease